MSSPLLLKFISSLAACLAFAQSAPPPNPRLRVMVPLEPSAPFDHTLEDVVKEFNARHPKTQVELVKNSSAFQSLRAIIAAHYANDLPDVALINTADLPTLSALGIVQPLPPAWVAARKFVPSLMSVTKCGSSTCAAPFQRRVPIWFFNRELLFKMNQETEKIPTNWGKLASFSQKLGKQGELWGLALAKTGESAIVRWGSLGMPPGLSADALADWVGKMWGTPGNWLPGTPTAEETTRLFLEQRAAILLGGLDQIPFLRSNASFRFGTALPEGELTWSGNDFVVLGKGKSAEQALEFLEYLYRPDVSLTIFKAATTLPVTKGQADHAGWRKEIDAQPVIKAALARKPKGVGLEKIAPQSREELAGSIWEAIEQVPEQSQRAAKVAELKTKLQKKLSSNPH